MFTACQLRINRQRLGRTPRERVVEGAFPVFSWAIAADRPILSQSAFRLVLRIGDATIHDTGRVASSTPEYRYTGEPLPAGQRLTASLTLWDNEGGRSEPLTEVFYRGDIPFDSPWIAASRDEPERAVYLRRDFHCEESPCFAVLYACGLGYHQITLNGQALDDALLDPAHTDYTRRLCYAVLPEAQRLLHPGENALCVVLGEGWRRNEGPYLDAAPRKPPFFGPPQLSAKLVLTYSDGRSQIIATDGQWQWRHGPIVQNHLFNGETYDARQALPGWDLPGAEGFEPVRLAPAPGGKPEPMLIPPIRVKAVYHPIALSQPKPGMYVADFGQNIAGVVRLGLHGLSPGQRITLTHMELLDEDGTLYLPNLRGARQQDCYIAAGGGRDADFWQPAFTYHGFRYVAIEGYCPREEELTALQLYTDLDKGSYFSCGSALLTQIHRNILMTERDNMHSILTDCPQRDERMGWMNDATVRFEETPFNFETGAMFRKVVRDIAAGQRPDGAISCTSPFVYGAYPADAVCSSYLVAAWQNYLHCGDRETIEENFDGFAAWEKCLLENSSGYIVDYSYYGDWAGPAYACQGEDGAVSAVTPGALMSTGYSYLNACLLERFAHILGQREKAEEYQALAEHIRSAMLEKWYCPQTAAMATGSQGCQAFALWLGLIPEPDRPRAARLMRDDLVARNYRFTTGNLCTRYLLDMLTEYGYADEAYRLMTREEYPSFGYMIQQEATTIWERFELKKNPGMNSHNHPMYGAAGAWFFTGLAGIRPTAAGFSRCLIRPAFPRELMSLQASVDTVRGRVSVKWLKRYRRLHLYVDLPPMTTAELIFAGQSHTLEPGSHHLSVPLDESAEMGQGV